MMQSLQPRIEARMRSTTTGGLEVWRKEGRVVMALQLDIDVR